MMVYALYVTTNTSILSHLACLCAGCPNEFTHGQQVPCNDQHRQQLCMQKIEKVEALIVQQGRIEHAKCTLEHATETVRQMRGDVCQCPL